MFKRLRKAAKLVKDILELPKRIATIEERVRYFESTMESTMIVPFTWQGCIDDKGCEYPNPWFGINPAPCNKCGITPVAPYTITFNSIN